MKQRAARLRPRTLIVRRDAGWGTVTYLRKRSYYHGWHYPATPLNLQMTARVMAL